ncbi:MAG TPA: SO2930 family diheme c-type cytochrome [Blastocatellia bacterium]|nr:SO2930 family diheme c-type cytochrome [Blastocatellia bacterium]
MRWSGRRARLAVIAAFLLPALLFISTCDKLRRPGVQSFVEEPFPAKLSEWQLFAANGAPLQPNKGVVPYDLNTPLFSDYASKYRFVWMPAGSSAEYREDAVFEFPVGTVLVKSFAFPTADASEKERLIETRLLVRANSGWVALPYVWNENQTEATLERAANPTEVSWTDAAKKSHNFTYNIPNVNECAQCHDNAKTLLPIGPKARNLNRNYNYADGPANQLAYWSRVGYLKGAPVPDEAPKVAVWNDPATGSVEARARAYLDNNCAHCHQPGGTAGHTGVHLGINQTELRMFGACKLPNSMGYSGGLLYDLVPGKPDESILLFRMKSTRAKEMMPEVGRSTVHEEGVALVREWLASLKGECSSAPVQARQ